MYLSRIELNHNKRETQIALHSLSRFHGAIESAFKESTKTRKLWRIDTLQGNQYLLIVSESKPNFMHLIKQFGFDNQTGESLSYDTFIDHIKTGQKWRFRLVANPTQSVSDKAHPEHRGKIKAEVSDKYLQEWILRKAEQNGFHIVDEVFIKNKRWYSFKKGKNAYHVRFKAVTFEGVLEVTDETLLKQALIAGIGREKAYGMGMLTLMRI